MTLPSLVLLAAALAPVPDSLVVAEAFRVPEVVVEAARPSARGLPYARTELDPDRGGPGSVRDLADLLAGSPGVAVRRTGGLGTPSLVSLRGASPDGVLLLRDGARLNGAAGGGVDLSTIFLDGVERVDVLRGGASLLYGGNAIGGVVDLVSVPGSPGNDARASVEVGSLGAVAGSGAIARAWGAGWARLAARSFRSDGDFSYDDSRRGAKTVRLDSGASGRAADGLFIRPTPAGDLRFGARVSRSEAGSPGLTEFPTPGARRDDASESFDAKLIGRGGEIALTAGRTERGHADLENSLGPIDERHTARTVSARGERRLHGGPASLDLGFEARREGLASTTDGDRARRTGAVFGVARLEPRAVSGARWSVSGGLRFDAITAFAPSVSSRIGASTSVSSARARAAFGTSFRAPGFDDLFWNATGFAVGNPDLAPEHGVDWDIGVDWTSRAAGGKASVDVFHQAVEDLIVWTPGPASLWRPSNVARAEIRGVEATITLNAREARRLPRVDANATLLSARDRSGQPNTDGRFLPGRARRFASWRIEKGFGRRLRLETAWRAVGPVPRTAANTKHISAYLVGSVALRVMPRPGLEARAEVENIGDASYEDFHDFPLPGRQFRVAFAWRRDDDAPSGAKEKQ